MKEKDVLTKEYLSVGKRFADAVNVGVFKGKQVISPDQIQEIDSVANITLTGRKVGKKEVREQYRDVLKTVAYNTNFCIIGVENQSKVHYVFPVRGMLYDAVSYKKQWNEIKREHREKKDLTGAEFLSGFSKEDSLRAVVTLVVYYGTEPWDGAMDIHSLIDWTDMPEELKAVVPNYSIHLLDLSQYENPDDFKSDLKVVCRFLQNASDKGKMEKMLKEHEDEFIDMEEDTYNLIGAFGDMEQIDRLKEECKNDRGGYNMCKGMRDWLIEKEELGRSEGLELGRSVGLELGRSEGKEELLMELIKKKMDKGYPVDEIAEFLETDIEEIQRLLEKIQQKEG